jgi:hypothetical protein
MQIITFLGIGLFLAACSGSDSDGSEPCSGAHRSGTYVAHFTERAHGNCGPIADQVVQISTGPNLPPGCAFDATDTGSVDQCTLTRAYTCPLDGAPGTISIVGVSKEEDGGARFVGTETARVYDGSGALVCSSTYDVVWARQ